LITSGNIIKDKAILPDIAENCLNGLTIHKYAIIPITIEGIPWSVSTRILTISVYFFLYIQIKKLQQ